MNIYIKPYFQIIRILTVCLLLIAFAIALNIPLRDNAKAQNLPSCDTAATLPSWAAPPSDVFSGHTLAHAYCASSGIGQIIITPTPGKTQLIWHQGYHWNGSSWEKFTWNGGSSYLDQYPTWRVGEVAKSFSNLSAGTQYVVFYVCITEGGQWKCGCKNTSCTTSSWQLRLFTVPSRGSSGGYGEFQQASLSEAFESYEWDPQTGCNFGTGCFTALGCSNGKNMIVRRVSEACTTQTNIVTQWTGGKTSFHSGNTADHGSWVAAHVPGPAGLLELLTSRKKFGIPKIMQAEFYPHDNLGYLPDNSGEHYVVMHNLNLPQISSCSHQCPGILDTGSGNVAPQGNRWEWYGVIAGGFGSEELGFGKLGFVIEKATDDGSALLVPESYLRYDPGGIFPTNRWYRIKIETTSKTYSYTAYYQDNYGNWQTIGTRSVPLSRLKRTNGTYIEDGYIGITDAFFDPYPHTSREKSSVHVDWDNIQVTE